MKFILSFKKIFWLLSVLISSVLLSCSDNDDMPKDVTGIITTEDFICKWQANNEVLFIEMNSSLQDPPAYIVFIDNNAIYNSDIYPYSYKMPIKSGKYKIGIAYSNSYQKVGEEPNCEITLNPTSTKWVEDDIVIP